MIWKLFKYDFRGVGKKLFPLYGLALLFALMSRIFVIGKTVDLYGNMETYESYPIWIQIIHQLIFGMAWILVVSVFIVTFIILITKYFRSVYGEEGYLTHTLPITSSQKIISKMFNFYLWNVFAALIATACIFIMFYNPEGFREFIEVFMEGLRRIWPMITSREILAAFLWSVIFVIAPIHSILLLYLCCAVGSMFRHKFIASVCAYFVLSFVMAIISNILLSSFIEFMIQSDYMPMLQFPLILLVMSIIYTLIFFFGTKILLDKQLNLE